MRSQVYPGVARVIAVLRAALLVALLTATAFGTLISALHFRDVRLPVLAVGILATAPGWVLLVLAARGRGAPWGWLAFAAGWGAFAAAWIALTAEVILGSISEAIGRAAEGLGRTVAEAAPAAIIAPLAEEPAKLLGVWIAFSAARRAGAAASLGLGAAIGGLVGLAFGVAEVAHHLGVVVNELGAFDLSGTFLVDWRLIHQIAEQEAVHKFFLAGLTNHALFSALAGAGLGLFAQRRRRLAVTCLVAAFAAHALLNAVGPLITERVIETVVEALGGVPARGLAPLLVGWLAGLGAFLVAEGWAAVLLIRILVSAGREPAARRALARP